MTPRVKTVAVVAVVAVLVLAVAAVPLFARDSSKGRWLKIRVYDDDSTTPTVLVNLPMSLVTAFVRIANRTEIKSHVDISTEGGEHGHVRLKDVDLEELIQQLDKMEPGQILEAQENGRRVSIAIE